jgi:hypothetical protein
MPRNERRPIFVDITLLFATKTDSRLEPVDCIRTYVYELKFRSRCSPARRFIPSTSTPSPARLRWCSQVGSASSLDSLNCAVSGASNGRGEGRTIKDAPLARETVEQLDDFAGWVKAKRVELAPVQAVLSCEKLNDGRLPDKMQ